MFARDLMSTAPVTAQVNNSLREVRDWMFSAGIRHVPVVHEGSLVAFVSDRDLHDDGEALEAKLDEWISDVMRGQTVTISPDSSMKEVMQVMVENKLSSLPVVNDERQLLGVVSYLDIFRHLLTSME
ncbi:MAG: CBS domain-containing protein [Myxococcales bacterium]|nr:CBS domain-containing protein [Myxococcales bacterium]